MDRRGFIIAAVGAGLVLPAQGSAASPNAPKGRPIAVGTARVRGVPMVLEVYGDAAERQLRVYAAHGRKRRWYTISEQFFDEADALFGRLKAGLAFGGGGRGVTAKLRGNDKVRLTGGPFGEASDLSYTTQTSAGHLTVTVITLVGLLAAGIVGATTGSTGGAAQRPISDFASQDNEDEDRGDGDDSGGEGSDGDGR